MKVTLSEHQPGSEYGYLVVVREPHDPKYYSESTLWYHIKRALLKQGYDVIKKNPGRDGHLTGAPYYLRTRKGAKGRSFYVWHEMYALEALYAPFNEKGTLELDVAFDVWR